MRTNHYFGEPTVCVPTVRFARVLTWPFYHLQSLQFKAMSSKHASKPYEDPHTLEAYRTVARHILQRVGDTFLECVPESRVEHLAGSQFS